MGKDLLHNLEMSKEWEVFQKRQQDKMRLLVRRKVVKKTLERRNRQLGRI